MENKIEGRNAVLEALRAGKPIDKLYVLDGCPDGPVRTIIREAKKGDTIINYVKKERLDQLSETGHHQGVIAMAASYEYATVEDILEKAYARGISIVLNPSPFEDCILSWQLEKVSLFFINEVEGGQMTQKSEPKDILDQMLFQYPDAAVVLTLGEKGAWYADREKRYFCPAQRVQAVDTTAAGDTFTGYFLMAQEKGFSAEQSLSIAAQASAIAVSRKGASVSVPVWAELQMDL